MVKRWNSSGQFYLVAAIVLSFMVVGMISVSNYLGKSSSASTDDLADEIKIESRAVINYGIANDFNNDDFYTTILGFTKDYVEYAGPSKDIYFLFGTTSNLTVSGYHSGEEEIIVYGTDNATVTEESGEFTKSINPGGTEAILYIDGKPNSFTLTEGRNIYFVLSEELNNGQYIVTWQ